MNPLSAVFGAGSSLGNSGPALSSTGEVSLDSSNWMVSTGGAANQWLILAAVAVGLVMLWKKK